MDFLWIAAFTERGGILSGFRSSDRFVAFLLARFRNPENGECFPSQVTLADAAGLSRETVNKALQRLEQADIISGSAQRPRSVKKYCEGSKLREVLERFSANEVKKRGKRKRTSDTYMEVGYVNGL